MFSIVGCARFSGRAQISVPGLMIFTPNHPPWSYNARTKCVVVFLIRNQTWYLTVTFSHCVCGRAYAESLRIFRYIQIFVAHRIAIRLTHFFWKLKVEKICQTRADGWTCVVVV